MKYTLRLLALAAWRTKKSAALFYTVISNERSEEKSVCAERKQIPRRSPSAKSSLRGAPFFFGATKQSMYKTIHCRLDCFAPMSLAMTDGLTFGFEKIAQDLPAGGGFEMDDFGAVVAGGLIVKFSAMQHAAAFGIERAEHNAAHSRE